MGIVDKYVEYGERRLGIPFPEGVSPPDSRSLDPLFGESRFTPNQTQFLIDTAKVTVTGFIAKGIESVASLRDRRRDI